MEINIDNCMDCTSHMVLPDPDPHDWFCDDDIQVVCVADNGHIITCACRPYNARKECDIPDWCPKSR